MPVVLNPSVHEADGHRPFADCRSHPFDRSAPNVSRHEDAGPASLQEVRLVPSVPVLAISRGAGGAPGQERDGKISRRGFLAPEGL
jgi:hypothetical protein